MKIRNQQDFWAGVMFFAFGAGFVLAGTKYAYGTAERMGPGYFPAIVGVLLALIGIGVALGALNVKAEVTQVKKFAWPSLFLIIGSVAIFGMLLEVLGLVASIFLLVCIASFASHEFSWKASVLNAAVLIAISLVVFVYLLGLQFTLWPAMLKL